MRPRFGLVLIGITCIAPTLGVAEDFFLTIGGGNAPSANQASLERNVLFFQRVLLEEKLQHCHHSVFFSDGEGDAHDLQVMDRDAVPTANRLMAEFFGSRQNLGLTYRNHEVPDVRGGTRPENIRTWFEEVGSTMESGDRLIVYVTAHGGRSREKDNPHDTTIATWNNTSIRMTEFATLLDGLPEGVEVVTVMVQCHSGGFARLIFSGGDSERGLAPQSRVGFFATVHDRPASGCTPEIDEADYVEYSSYFWAAVCGLDRIGQRVSPPDYDGDGMVSFDEAHAYTVLTANTIDLPVKTSEAFLAEFSKFDDENPELLTRTESYESILELATEPQRAVLEGLSEQLNLEGDDRIADARNVFRPERGSSRGASRSSSRGRRPEPPYMQLRRKIAGDLKRRWPELANVLNPVAIDLVTTRADEFVQAVEQHPDYQRYRESYDEARSSLDDRKNKVKYERFVRTAENVALAENLRRLGDEEKILQYEAILAAESQALNP